MSISADQAARVEELELKEANIKRQVSTCNWGLSEAEWSKPQRCTASSWANQSLNQPKNFCERQIYKPEPTSRSRGFRASFMKFFTIPVFVLVFNQRGLANVMVGLVSILGNRLLSLGFPIIAVSIWKQSKLAGLR